MSIDVCRVSLLMLLKAVCSCTMILWRNWGGWHALNVFFSKSSMYVGFTLMRGNSKSDTLKRKMTIEKTTRH